MIVIQFAEPGNAESPRYLDMFNLEFLQVIKDILWFLDSYNLLEFLSVQKFEIWWILNLSECSCQIHTNLYNKYQLLAFEREKRRLTLFLGQKTAIIHIS